MSMSKKPFAKDLDNLRLSLRPAIESNNTPEKLKPFIHDIIEMSFYTGAIVLTGYPEHKKALALKELMQWQQQVIEQITSDLKRRGSAGNE